MPDNIQTSIAGRSEALEAENLEFQCEYACDQMTVQPNEASHTLNRSSILDGRCGTIRSLRDEG